MARHLYVLVQCHKEAQETVEVKAVTSDEPLEADEVVSRLIGYPITMEEYQEEYIILSGDIMHFDLDEWYFAAPAPKPLRQT